MERSNFLTATGCAISLATVALLVSVPAGGQTSQSQQHVINSLRQVITRDRQRLMHYSWTENVTVSSNGTTVKQRQFRVHFNGSGKLVRSLVSESPSGSSQYDQYGKQLIALAQRYTHLDPNKLRQLQAAGNVEVRSIGPPGVSQLDIDNYAKQGDSLTLNFNTSQNTPLGYIVFTYLNDPSDDVGMSVTFARLADGTTYTTGVATHSDSRNVDVLLANSDFKRDR